MAPYTPQQQAENMMEGIKNTYQVVAKRHVHPWYSWALMAAAIGFTVGVAYVANQNAQFDSSQAASRTVTPIAARPAPVETDPLRVYSALAKELGLTPGKVSVEPTTRSTKNKSRFLLGKPLHFNLATPAGKKSFESLMKEYAQKRSAYGLLMGGKDYFVLSNLVDANSPLINSKFNGAITVGPAQSSVLVGDDVCKCDVKTSFKITCGDTDIHRKVEYLVDRKYTDVQAKAGEGSFTLSDKDITVNCAAPTAAGAVSACKASCETFSNDEMKVYADIMCGSQGVVVAGTPTNNSACSEKATK